jgi:hypothetical protein
VNPGERFGALRLAGYGEGLVDQRGVRGIGGGEPPGNRCCRDSPAGFNIGLAPGAPRGNGSRRARHRKVLGEDDARAGQAGATANRRSLELARREQVAFHADREVLADPGRQEVSVALNRRRPSYVQIEDVVASAFVIGAV